jgi:hypothetical protein
MGLEGILENTATKWQLQRLWAGQNGENAIE